MAICPECESPLDLDEDELNPGDTLECEDCGAELEIASVAPLELVPVETEAFDEEEDSYGAE